MSRVGAGVWSFGTSWLEWASCRPIARAHRRQPQPRQRTRNKASRRAAVYGSTLRNTGAEGGPRSEAWTTAGGWLLSATQTYPADRDWGPAGPGICRFARSDQELAYEYISICRNSA